MEGKREARWQKRPVEISRKGNRKGTKDKTISVTGARVGHASGKKNSDLAKKQEKDRKM